MAGTVFNTTRSLTRKTDSVHNCFVLLLMLMVLAACEPMVKQESVEEPVAPAETPKKPAEKKVKAKPEVAPPGVAVLVSSDATAYTDIASQLVSKLGKRATLYNLNDDATRSKNVIETVQASNAQQVVTIGLLASRAAHSLKNKQVVYCQVFNHEDMSLVKPWMKGVSMVPSADRLFAIWKQLDPKLTEVVLLSGKNKEHLVEKATASAQKAGVKLIHRAVTTDLDMIYVVKNLPQSVQGIWLLPDNRVLSNRAIREVMSYSVKHGKQVAAFHPDIMKLGALLSVQYNNEDVVNTVIKRLDSAVGKKIIPGDDVVMLRDADILINVNVANRMGLSVPDYLKNLVYVP